MNTLLSFRMLLVLMLASLVKTKLKVVKGDDFCHVRAVVCYFRTNLPQRHGS